MTGADDRAARLQAALTRLAQDQDSWTTNREGKAARDLKVDGSDAVIDALLAEVMDTVLPARLILSGAEAQVELAVAGRRVQGLLGASEDVMAASEAVTDGTPLVDQVLDAEETGPVAALGGIVRSVAEGAGPFTLRSEIAPRLGAEAEPGLTPDQLREIWGARAATVMIDGEALAGFLHAVEATVRGGIIVRDGNIDLQVGDETLATPLVDVLEAAWPDFQADRARIAQDHADPSLTCWQQSGGPVVAVAAWPDDGVAALAFLPEAMPEILSVWSRTLAE